MSELDGFSHIHPQALENYVTEVFRNAHGKSGERAGEIAREWKRENLQSIDTSLTFIQPFVYAVYPCSVPGVAVDTVANSSAGRSAPSPPPPPCPPTKVQ